jgi:radical SAM superfamily enzyme YgiQ (UPF0313 family)
MRVMIVRPRIGIHIDNDRFDKVSMEPLTVSVLAALTPPGIHVDFQDDRMEDLDYDRPADLVAITVETFTARRAYEIARHYRERGVPVVMGGVHATLAPQEVGLHADAVCRGDAESVWTSILSDAAQAHLRPMYDATDADVLPQPVVPRTEIYAKRRYLPLSLAQFSRGCPHHCTFCAASAAFQSRHLCRDPRAVVDELRKRNDNRILFFVDDNLTADAARAKHMLHLLKPLGKKWVCQLGVDAADDVELLKLLRAAGCIGFVVGFESIERNNLLSMNKTPNIAGFGRYGAQLETLRDFGFSLWAAFTLGHDFDTGSSLDDLAAFALKHRFAFAAFNTLTPYPGTALYKRLLSEGRLLYDGKWWLHPDYRYNFAAFQPRHMSADALTEHALAIRKRFNSLPSIASRSVAALSIGSGRTALAQIFRYGLFFKREVRRKQGMPLG